jgi:hypothetical protein
MSEDRLYKALERIARAHGITTPLVLVGMAENNDENYAEILARYIEKKMAKHADRSKVQSGEQREELLKLRLDTLDRAAYEELMIARQ